MDDDGSNVEKVGHINIGSALHPTVLKDGRVMFTSYEAQGLRDQRNWALWAMWPDGRYWEPLMSAFSFAAAFHFQTQLGDGRIAVVEYYNLNNNGFGTLLAFDSVKNPAVPPFGKAQPGDSSNPAVRRGLWYFQPGHPSHLKPRYKSYPFSPPGLVNLTGFTHGEDEASSRALDGSFAGKVTHPAAAPDNDVMLVYSPGPANSLNRPTSTPYYDGGIYILRGGVPANDHRDLVLIKNDLRYNEMMPRPVVPYSAIYGVAEPAKLPYLPNDGTASSALPAGSPFGLIGTSSFYKRDTTPGVYTPWNSSSWNNLDVFNTGENDANSNWFEQGADSGKYSNADIFAVRIVALEGVAHRSYGPGIGNNGIIGFSDHAGAERLRILGEIPLRKPGGVIDPDGNPDTSFIARIPADTPFTFQTLDRDGLVLNMAQTWHQVRPGETRTDCGGCHAHSQMGTDFRLTAAGRGASPIVDLVDRIEVLTKDPSGNTVTRTLDQRALDVEYYRDIKPILQRSCVQCHSRNGNAEAGLVLDDTTIVGGYENTYNRLANDSGAKYGIPPVISAKTWRQSNASRYVRAFQSRRSLLMWKIMGRRLDGWTDADHPTETVPGNTATLPSGANPNEADLDFSGTIMPPANAGVPPLSDDEKMLFARWIDLGCPISTTDSVLKANLGWFFDDLRPTLTVSSPAERKPDGALSVLRFGAYDSYSGLDRASISVTANFTVNGQPAGTELATWFGETSPYVWSLALSPSITSLAGGRITVRVKDLQGNWSVVDRVFDISAPPAPADYFIPDRGVRSWDITRTNVPLTVGYARISPDQGNAAPAGIAIIGYRTGGVLVSEAGVPASESISSGRIHVEIDGAVNTGIAMANPNDQDSSISFYFTDTAGVDFGHGSFVLKANSQISAFLNELPFNASAPASGTFTFTSSKPVAVIALRGIRNERSEFLITTLTVSRIGAAASGSVLPHFADGAGWTSQIVLTNVTDQELTGRIQFLDPQSGVWNMTVNGTSASVFNYRVRPRSSFRLVTGGGTGLRVGSVRMLPDTGSGLPSAIAIFSFKRNGVTVSEASVTAEAAGSAFRVYAESLGTLGQVGSIRTGIAIVNPGTTPVEVVLEVRKLDGSAQTAASLTIPAGGQIARFIHEIVAGLPEQFQGLVRLTSSSPIVVNGLRGRYNERGDFLTTTTPPWNEATAPSNAETVFPHIVDGGGYSTQLILLGPSVAGKLWFLSKDGVLQSIPAL